MTRVCIKCGNEKPIKEFYKRGSARRGVDTACKTCRNVRMRILQRYREFGMTEEDHTKMLSEQNGVCAICGKPDPLSQALAVDHDHETGVVRGLLCSHCNKGLGLFRENAELLVAAAEYIKKAQSK